MSAAEPGKQLGEAPMGTRLAVGGYVIEHDRAATVAAYSRIVIPGPEECGCWYCRN